MPFHREPLTRFLRARGYIHHVDLDVWVSPRNEWLDLRPNGTLVRLQPDPSPQSTGQHHHQPTANQPTS